MVEEDTRGWCARMVGMVDEDTRGWWTCIREDGGRGYARMVDVDTGEDGGAQGDENGDENGDKNGDENGDQEWWETTGRGW